VEFEFATCYALHNMLVNVDGLSKAWKYGVRSRWEMKVGEFQDQKRFLLLFGDWLIRQAQRTSAYGITMGRNLDINSRQLK
jgi:hypothetical protein